MAGFDPYHEWLGIPPKHQPPTHYRLLGIEPGEDDAKVIENAADRQMLLVRTYQAGEHAQDSQRLLNEISAAKVVLLSPQKRAAYDRELRARQQADQRAAPRAVRRPAPKAKPEPKAKPATRLEPAPQIVATPKRGRRPAWLIPAAVCVVLAGVVAFFMLRGRHWRRPVSPGRC